MKTKEFLTFIVNTLNDSKIRAFTNKDFLLKVEEEIKDKVHDKNYLFKSVFEEFTKHPTAKGRSTVKESVLFRLKPDLYFVYKLYCKEELVYIGFSKRVSNRLNTHLKDKEVDKIELCKCSSKEEAEHLENHLILKHKPSLNKSVNLRLARLHTTNDTHLFVSPEDMDYDLVPAVGYLFTENTQGKHNKHKYFYSRSCKIYIRNNDNIKPYWWYK